MKLIKTCTIEYYMKVLKAIMEKTGKNENEVSVMIELKRKSLDYLISEEGAIHILASELGIVSKPEFKIKDLQDGTSGIDIFVKVIDAIPMREFKRNGKLGKVRNLFVEDETGELRVSLWDDKAELDIKPNTIIKIIGAYVKQNGANLEMRAGRYSTIDLNPKNPPELLTIKEEKPKKTLKTAENGDILQIKASLTKVFDREPFFNNTDGPQLIISGFIDDKTASMRAIFFRTTVEPLIGMTRKVAIEKSREEILDNVKLFTNFFLVGRIKYNDFTDSNEFIVNSVHTIDMGEEVDNKINNIIDI